MEYIICVIIGSIILFFILKKLEMLEQKSFNKIKQNIEKNKDDYIQYRCGDCISLENGHCKEINMSVARHDIICSLFEKKEEPLFSTEQEHKT